MLRVAVVFFNMQILDMNLGVFIVGRKVSIASINGPGGFLGSKKHLDWLKIDFNVTDIITVQDYNKKKLMWMEVHIYSVQAKSQAGNISVKHVMIT